MLTSIIHAAIQSCFFNTAREREREREGGVGGYISSDFEYVNKLWILVVEKCTFISFSTKQL